MCHTIIFDQVASFRPRMLQYNCRRSSIGEGFWPISVGGGSNAEIIMGEVAVFELRNKLPGLFYLKLLLKSEGERFVFCLNNLLKDWGYSKPSWYAISLVDRVVTLNSSFASSINKL